MHLGDEYTIGRVEVGTLILEGRRLMERCHPIVREYLGHSLIWKLLSYQG